MKRTVFVAAWIAIVVALCAGIHAQSPQQPAPQPSQPAAAQQPLPQPPAATAPRLPASPRGLAATQVAGKWTTPDKPGASPQYAGGKWITVDYGRPILRGRTNIFGTDADYGKAVNDDGPVWRAGANQTTRLKTEVPLAFGGGKTLPAGEYSLFVDLKPGAWTLIVSSQPFQQKYRSEQQDRDLGRVQLRPEAGRAARADEDGEERRVGRPVHDPVRQRHRAGRDAGHDVGKGRRLGAVQRGAIVRGCPPAFAADDRCRASSTARSVSTYELQRKRRRSSGCTVRIRSRSRWRTSVTCGHAAL